MTGHDRGPKNGGSSSKPFVVSAVLLAFAGSLIGAVWMTSLFGPQLLLFPHLNVPFQIHRTVQIDGFLTVLIMGIGYMIVPRFRNSILPSTHLAYVSLALILVSNAISIMTAAIPNEIIMLTIAGITRLAGIAIFAGMVFWMLRRRPKLLGFADYFIALSIGAIVLVSLSRAAGILVTFTLTEIHLLLLFPLLMIFGVEYKTLPSFLGFIRPRKKLAMASLALAMAALSMGFSSTRVNSILLPIVFDVALFGCAATLAHSLYIFGGFDKHQILKLISGEKKARYLYTMIYSKLSYLFLYASIAFAIFFLIVSSLSSSVISYPLYDLSIHFMAIGFIGTTIALYLPLMLPAIIGKQVYFAKFSHTPLLLLIASLGVRAIGDISLVYGGSTLQFQFFFSYLLIISGWMVVLALAEFVIMIHKSTKGLAETANKDVVGK